MDQEQELQPLQLRLAAAEMAVLEEAMQAQQLLPPLVEVAEAAVVVPPLLLLQLLVLAQELATAWTATIPIWSKWRHHMMRVDNDSSAICSIP